MTLDIFFYELRIIDKDFFDFICNRIGVSSRNIIIAQHNMMNYIIKITGYNKELNGQSYAAIFKFIKDNKHMIPYWML